MIFWRLVIHLILDSPLKLLKAGNVSARNVMAGATRDDGSIFLAPIAGKSPISLEICKIRQTQAQFRRRASAVLN